MAESKLVITSKENIIYYGYFCEGKAVELFCEPRESESMLGNIYVARVDKVAAGIQGAFLDLADGKKAYYNLSRNLHPVKLSPGHEDGLYGGDLILVQISKDAVKTKLPVADANVSISGKYFLLTMANQRLSLSKKIADDSERQRLKSIAEPYLLKNQYGLVVRTNAQGVSESQLIHELEVLKNRYMEIIRRANHSVGKTLLYRNPPDYITLAKELPKWELSEIVIEDSQIYDEFVSFYKERDDQEILKKLRKYTEDYSLYQLYRFEHFYQEALQKTVFLKSGGTIVIEQTEAMVVIDVNSGAVIKTKNKAKAIFEKMNLEAADEIFRQLRIRNLSGIIVIDFINMKDKEAQKHLLAYLKQKCKEDRIATQLIDLTALHLVEMTRSKVKRPLYEQWKICHQK